MTDSSTECGTVQPLLREHVLGLLSEREARQVDEHLKGCDACRAVLAAKQAALAVLDALPDAPPPAGLADRTLRRIRTSETERQTRPSFSWRWNLMELVAFVCVVGTIAAILLPSLARSRESARRSSCQNNLKQMGLVLKMYANENAGVYPPMVPVNGVWTLDLRAVYPEYLTDPAVLFCPTSAESSGLPALMDALKRKPPDWERAQRLVGRQYVYLGWAFRDEQDFEGVLTGPPSTPCTDLKVGERTVYWLRDGVEKQLVEDKANAAETATQRSLIPVMCDNPACSPHKPGGVNVLYLDGHVEFLRLGSKFPALPSVARQFGGLPPEK